MRTRRLPRRLAALVAGTFVLIACQTGDGGDPPTADPGAQLPAAEVVEPTEPAAPGEVPDAEPMEMTADDTDDTDAEPMETTVDDTGDTDDAEPGDDASAGDDPATSGSGASAAEQRCLDTLAVLDRRIEAENFEYPDEEPELSEEELAETLRPEFDVDDSVASPDERPELAPMSEFDPNTAPILELDLLVETCFETGILTEDEFDDDGEDLDEDAEFAAWCEELAALPIEEVREFAEDEGADIVREEFEACQLPNPLDTST